MNSGRLIQNGVDNFGGKGANGDYAWWEVLSGDPKASLPEIKIKNLAVKAGDRIFTGANYYPDKKQIEFAFYDYRTGKSVSLGPWAAIDTPKGSYLGSYFYDGSTAEQIGERATVGGTPVMLRKPHAGYSSVHEAGFFNGKLDGEDFSFPSVYRETMTRNGLSGKNSVNISDPTGFITKAKSLGTYLAQWKDRWDRCS